MAEKIEVGVTIKGTGNASTQLNALDKGIKKAGTGMGGLIKATDAFTGGAASGMISAYSGTLKFIKGLKLTKVALISTGIGAIVVLVGALVASFMSSEEQAKKLKVMMAGLGAVVKRVGGFFKAVGGFIAGLFGGGVTKGLENYRGEMDKMPGSMKDAILAAEELERKVQELELAFKNLSFEQERLATATARSNFISQRALALAKDSKLSVEQRIGLTEQANASEQENIALRKEVLEEEMRIAELRMSASIDYEENRKLYSSTQAQLVNLDLELFNLKRTQSKRINDIRDAETKKAEESAERQKEAAEKVAEAERAKADAIRAAEEARVKSMMESVDQGVLFVLEAQAKELEALELSYFKLEEAQLDYLDEIEANEFAFAEGELKRQEDHLELMEKTFNEKKKAINEKFALAEQAEKIKLEDELFALTLTAKEREELAIQQQFDNRIAIAGDDEGLIKKATERQIADLQAIEDKAAAERVAKEEAVAKAVNTARMSVVDAGFKALGVMAKTEEGTKALAISQILVNQGIAMSNAVVAGLSAAAKMPQPAGLFAAPGFVASALAIALTSFASIKGVMNQAGAPTAGVGGGGGSGGQAIASNRDGPTLGLTPDISESLTPGSIPPINAYVVQTQLADQNALAEQIKAATTL